LIRIRLVRDGEGRCLGYEASGHAGAAPHGHDVVCAAVSALLQSTLLGLSQVVRAEVTSSQRSGRFVCTLAETSVSTEGVRALLETLALSVRQLEVQYPTFVRVEEKRRRSRSGGRAIAASKRRGKGASSV
jgi:uncharacterized protein